MDHIKKILITGASGYCGNFLAMHFAKKGIPVIGFDLKPHPVNKEVSNYQFHAVDIRNKKAMGRIIEKEQPTHVIHLAYLMDPHHDKKFEYDVDVMGSRHIFELANQTKSVKQFILMSSASIYGGHKDNKDWLKEDADLRPHDYNYAVYKKAVERYYHKFHKRPDMKLVIFRMCTAVGPSYYKPGGVVSTVAKAPFLINLTDGNGKAQFIHEEDVISLFDKIVHDERVEDTFNLAPDSFTDTKELGQLFSKKVYPIRLFLLKGVFWLLWNLRLAQLTPAMARLMAYGIVIDPKKLMEQYQYTFKYSTQAAFLDAVEKRKANGTL